MWPEKRGQSVVTLGFESKQNVELQRLADERAGGFYRKVEGSGGTSIGLKFWKLSI